MSLRNLTNPTQARSYHSIATEVTEEKSEREKAYMPRKSIDRKERRSFVQL